MDSSWVLPYYFVSLMQSINIWKGELISFLTMLRTKNKNKTIWRKKIIEHFYGSWSWRIEKGTRMWSFSYENYNIKILTFCSLKKCLNFFLAQERLFCCKNVLVLLSITLKYSLSPLNYPYFPKYSSLRKM